MPLHTTSGLAQAGGYSRLTKYFFAGKEKSITFADILKYQFY